LFNKIYSFFKNFKNNKNSSKFNLYFFKNKKKNFKTSLNNFSITNKNKTWLKNKTLYFNNQNAPLFNVKSLIKMFLLSICVYYKWSIIYYYFSSILPYELFFGMDLYVDLVSTVKEFCVNSIVLLTLFSSLALSGFLPWIGFNLSPFSEQVIGGALAKLKGADPVKELKAVKALNWGVSSKKLLLVSKDLSYISRSVFNHTRTTGVGGIGAEYRRLISFNEAGKNNLFTYTLFFKDGKNLNIISQSQLCRNNFFNSHYWDKLKRVGAIESLSFKNSGLLSSYLWFLNRSNNLFKLSAYRIGIHKNIYNNLVPKHFLDRPNVFYNYNSFINFKHNQENLSNSYSNKFNSFFLKKKN